MCSCDYNQQELIALAQVTYSRFGHSLMRDLINNDIDIHGFMGTTIKGLFNGLPKFDVNDPEIVAIYNKIIKGFKSSNPKEFKSLRQMAKALDFGKSLICNNLQFFNMTKVKHRKKSGTPCKGQSDLKAVRDDSQGQRLPVEEDLLSTDKRPMHPEKG